MPIKTTIKTKRTSKYGGVPSLIANIETHGTTAAYNFARLFASNLRKYAPVGDRTYVDSDGNQHPGWLKKSVEIVRRAKGAFVVQIGAKYGAYVNYGTHRQAPQPFWEKSYELTKREFKRNYGQIMIRGK